MSNSGTKRLSPADPVRSPCWAIEPEFLAELDLAARGSHPLLCQPVIQVSPRLTWPHAGIITQ
jgi:hypothetical protein